ncbi:hypothetical protein Tco_0616372 [Tanacetum coccineum]
MEEYIRLEEEKAQKRGKVFNWETARISFGEFDDEDYMAVFDKKSFSYKIISTNDLKMDLENDNEKVNVPLFPLPDHTVSYIDDLDFFKDFENEFPAIVYNDALKSKSDFSTKPTLCPQHIDEFNLKDETSLSKYDEVEQNVLMLFNLIKNLYVLFGISFEPKRYYKDGDCARMLWRLRAIHHITPLLPRDQRHLWLRYQVNRVHILDFEGLTPDMRKDLAERIRMVYIGDDGQEVFVSHAWKRLFRIRAPLVPEFILEFFSTCRIGDAMRDFLRGAPSYTYIRDLHGLRGSQRSYLLARYLKLFASRRKHGAMIYGGQFVARLVKHFGLLTEERLKGLMVIEPRGPAKQEGDAGGFTEEALVAPGGGDEDEEMPQTGQREGRCALHEIFRATGRVPEMHQAEDRWCQHFHSSAVARPIIPLSLIFCFYPLMIESSMADLVESKEIDEVSEVSIIWNPMCDCSHAGIQMHLQHTSLLINSTWRIYRAKYQGSFSF